MVGNRRRIVNDDIVNIICCPVNLGYLVKIWSWVELVRPSIRRLESASDSEREDTGFH